MKFTIQESVALEYGVSLDEVEVFLRQGSIIAETKVKTETTNDAVDEVDNSVLGANVFSAMQNNTVLRDVITEIPEVEVEVILVYDSNSESQSHSTSTSESQSFSESVSESTSVSFSASTSDSTNRSTSGTCPTWWIWAICLGTQTPSTSRFP